MRLGIFIYSLAGGGAERVVSYLLSYCITKNIKVYLICMNTVVKYEIPNGVEVHFLEKSNPDESGFIKAVKIPLLAYKYSRLVKRLNITHSLSFLTRPSFINVLASKLTNHQFIVITNERGFPSLAYGYKGFKSTFNKKMIKLLFKKADVVLSNSKGNAQDLVNNFEVPLEKMRVINNPIDLAKIENIEPIKSFFDESKFNLITVGRLIKSKNLKMLIDALHKLQNPNLRLYVFGIGELQEELEQHIINLDLKQKVVLMGFDPNPYKYLKAADLFIFGSNHEGFPNVLLEAMACGLPILSTNCDSGPSEILELKTTRNDLMITDYGILVPIKNMNLMAKGINHIVNNKVFLQSCKINVQKRVKDFKKDHILKKYIDIISTTI